MTNRGQHVTAILYEHALLGEGIAQYLRAHAGADVTLAPTADPDAVLAALAADPGVVIFERGGLTGDLDLAQLAPHAELLDVSAAVCRGTATGPEQVGLEQIAQAVRRHNPAGRRARTRAGCVRHLAVAAVQIQLSAGQSGPG